MRNLGVEQLQPGLALARDVEDANGNRLLSKGTVLSQTQIELLQARRILDVWVEDLPAAAKASRPAQPGDAPAPAGDPIIEAARMRLKARFQGLESNPWMRALCEEAEKRLAIRRFWRSAL